MSLASISLTPPLDKGISATEVQQTCNVFAEAHQYRQQHGTLSTNPLLTRNYTKTSPECQVLALMATIIYRPPESERKEKTRFQVTKGLIQSSRKQVFFSLLFYYLFGFQQPFPQLPMIISPLPLLVNNISYYSALYKGMGSQEQCQKQEVPARCRDKPGQHSYVLLPEKQWGAVTEAR